MTMTQQEAAKLYAIRDLAREVREAQKKYFKTRSGAVLIEAKQLEAKLDKALNEFSDSPHDEITG